MKIIFPGFFLGIYNAKQQHWQICIQKYKIVFIILNCYKLNRIYVFMKVNIFSKRQK